MNMSELLLTTAWQASRMREQEDLIASMRDQIGELRQKAKDAEDRASEAERAARSNAPEAAAPVEAGAP